MQFSLFWPLSLFCVFSFYVLAPSRLDGMPWNRYRKKRRVNETENERITWTAVHTEMVKSGTFRLTVDQGAIQMWVFFLTFPESKFQCSTGQFSPQLTWTRVKSCLGLVWYSLLSLFFQPPVKLLTARRRSTYCREGSESRGKRQAGTFHSCFAINNDHIFQPAKLSKKEENLVQIQNYFFPFSSLFQIV